MLSLFTNDILRCISLLVRSHKPINKIVMIYTSDGVYSLSLALIFEPFSPRKVRRRGDINVDVISFQLGPSRFLYDSKS